VKGTQVTRLVHRIAYTLDVEIDCGECSRFSPRYVDALLDGQSDILVRNQDHWALFQAHLEQCPACAQEFLMLREIAKMDVEGAWPAITTLLEWATRGEPRV